MVFALRESLTSMCKCGRLVLLDQDALLVRQHHNAKVATQRTVARERAKRMAAAGRTSTCAMPRSTVQIDGGEIGNEKTW